MRDFDAEQQQRRELAPAEGRAFKLCGRTWHADPEPPVDTLRPLDSITASSQPSADVAAIILTLSGMVMPGEAEEFRKVVGAKDAGVSLRTLRAVLDMVMDMGDHPTNGQQD